MTRDGRCDFYGVTKTGGPHGGGVLFDVVRGKQGSAGPGIRVVHYFRSALGSVGANGGLLKDANGVLYGTTSTDGRFCFGTIFRMIA